MWPGSDLSSLVQDAHMDLSGKPHQPPDIERGLGQPDGEQRVRPIRPVGYNRDKDEEKTRTS